jgi:hypothetical protein
MNLAVEQTDPAFLADFLAARLDKADFNHRGHLRAAWLLLQRLPLDAAVEQACGGIQRLAAALGAADKFHRTRTEALVRLMAQAGAADPTLAWEAFLQQQPLLLRDARALLARHYSPALLDSPEARLHFVAPDLQALPDR